MKRGLIFLAMLVLMSSFVLGATCTDIGNDKIQVVNETNGQAFTQTFGSFCGYSAEFSLPVMFNVSCRSADSGEIVVSMDNCICNFAGTTTYCQPGSNQSPISAEVASTTETTEVASTTETTEVASTTETTEVASTTETTTTKPTCQEYKKCASAGKLIKGYCSKDGKQCVATYECKCTTNDKTNEPICENAKLISDKCVGAGVTKGVGLGKTKFVMPAWAKTIKESKAMMCSCPTSLPKEARDACIKSCQSVTYAVEKLAVSDELLKALQVAEEKMCAIDPKDQYCIAIQNAMKLSVPDLSAEMLEPAKMCKTCPSWWSKEQCMAYCKAYSDARNNVQTSSAESAQAVPPDNKICKCQDVKVLGDKAYAACIKKCQEDAKKTVKPGFLTKLFGKKSSTATGSFWSIFR